MDNISSYSGRTTGPNQRQQNEPSSRAGTFLSRDTRTHVSLGRTAGRILTRSNATVGSSEFARTGETAREKTERTRREDALFEAAMTQKFPRGGVTERTMSSTDTWIPGVRAEMPSVSRESYRAGMLALRDSEHSEDRKTYNQLWNADEIRGGRARMLRQEYNDYKSGRPSALSLPSYDNISPSSSSGSHLSQQTGCTDTLIEEMKEADRNTMTKLGISTIAIPPSDGT